MRAMAVTKMRISILVQELQKVLAKCSPRGMTFDLLALSLGWKVPFPPRGHWVPCSASLVSRVIGTCWAHTHRQRQADKQARGGGGNAWSAPSLGVECHSPGGNTSPRLSASIIPNCFWALLKGM
jgi:hypothetical protein